MFLLGRCCAMLVAGVYALSAPAPASAHVKWFNAAYCVSCSPPPLYRIFDRLWFLIFAFFALLSICAFIFDRMYSNLADQYLEPWLATLRARSEDYMRIGLGFFLLCVSIRSGILLTPELRTTNALVPWIQLGLAISTLSWRTTWIACLGVFGLYILAIEEYGFFHLLDYPIFLGIGMYLAIHSLRIQRLLPFAGSVLVAAVAGTLLWASFEKWAYWIWTMPLVAEHPDIVFGINPRLYILLAGFVEFFLAYFLLAGRFFGRLAAAGLLVIFISAVFDFGTSDFIGHLLIIVSLFIIMTQGKQPITDYFVQPGFGITRGALASIGILAAVLSGYAFAYFSLHHLIYG